jgi:hypothetical protein
VTAGELLTRLAFEAMGAASRARLRALGFRPNDRLDPGFRCLTTIVRVPERVGERIERALEPIRARWPDHRHYLPAAMHVTVMNLDPYLAGADGRDGIRELTERVDLLIAPRPPFRVTLRGLGLSPWTVFAQAYGADEPLRVMRDALRGGLHERADAPRRDSPLRRALPLVLSNVVRFTGPVDRTMIRSVERLRREAFGTFEVVEIQVVRTDGFLSPEETEVLARIPLTTG